MRKFAHVPRVKCRRSASKDEVLDDSSDGDSDKDEKDDSTDNNSNGKDSGSSSNDSSSSNSNNNNGNGNNASSATSNNNGNPFNGGNGQPPASGNGQPPTSGNGQPSTSGNGQPPTSGNGQSPSSGKGPGPSGPPITRVGCQFVNENDGRLQYTGLWTLETKDPTGFTTTTHTTETAGSEVAINFNGSMIIIVGIVHASNATVPPATAAYTIDTSPPTVLPLPVATQDIPNQQFFQSSQLTPGEHTLTINVTSNGSPYTLDYLFVCGSGGPALPVASGVGLHDDLPPDEFVSKTVTIIVGAILGTVMLMLLVALAYVLWWSKWRSTRRRRIHSPLKEWLQRQTLFTSSDSIMRNNPANPSAADHKDVVSNPPASDEQKSPSPDVPVYRTFAEFDSGFSFPISYRFSAQVSAQVPCSPYTEGRHDLSPHPALPLVPYPGLPNSPPV
ncbi:hypothetical protein EUX98_g7796 [Antrodiella citrinella]|uniref:Uncharacterized protein n=1 Tax=Antrodiella citrinella TaxID=2447956 RepID=A0A4V3XHT1_9APHY|nr:hypothetical protein EUX98_g7796 [Antrodiella citrinella]